MSATAPTSHHHASNREVSSFPGISLSSLSGVTEAGVFAIACLPWTILPKFLVNQSGDKLSYLSHFFAAWSMTPWLLIAFKPALILFKRSTLPLATAMP